MDKKVGIVIVNYNTFELLVQCIDSIIKYVKSEFQIFLVDNNSDLETQEKINEKYQFNELIKIIMSSENVGYSGGNNLGCIEAIKSNCEIILIVNSDIEFKNDIVSVMKKKLTEKTVVVGPKVVNLDNENGQYFINTYNYLDAIMDRYPFYIFKRLFIKEKSVDSLKNGFRGMVSGCCFMIDSKIFSMVDFFDDNVFLYSEERILSIKLNQLEKDACYEPLAVVLHKEGKSTAKKGNAFSDYHRYASDYYTVVRYLKVRGIKLKFFKYLRLCVFFLKCIKDNSYWKEYKRLRLTMKRIENGEYKIDA